MIVLLRFTLLESKSSSILLKIINGFPSERGPVVWQLGLVVIVIVDREVSSHIQVVIICIYYQTFTINIDVVDCYKEAVAVEASFEAVVEAEILENILRLAA